MEFGGLLLAVAIAVNAISTNTAVLSQNENVSAAVESMPEGAEQLAEEEQTEEAEALLENSSSVTGIRKNIFSTLMNFEGDKENNDKDTDDTNAGDTDSSDNTFESEMYLPEEEELRDMLIGSTQYIEIGDSTYPVTISRRTLDSFEVLDLDMDEQGKQLTAQIRFTVFDEIYEYTWTKEDTYDWNPQQAGWELSDSVIMEEDVAVSDDFALDLNEDDFLADIVAEPIEFDNGIISQTIGLEEDRISSLEIEEPYVDYSTQTYYVDTYFILDKDIVSLDVYASLGYKLKRSRWVLDDVEYDVQLQDADLAGVWSGSAGLQGRPDADLVIGPGWTNVFRGAFYYGPSSAEPEHEAGSYHLQGELNTDSMEVNFRGSKWINQPDNAGSFEFLGGTLLIDEKRITGDDLDLTLTDQNPEEYTDRFVSAAEPDEGIEADNTGADATDETAENPETTASEDDAEYILPGSDRHLLAPEDYQELSDADLQTAINELFARHGYIFGVRSIAEYFESLSWYQATVPASQFDESVFSEVEKQNLDALVAERERRK